jgi:predicted Zn-dependent protease
MKQRLFSLILITLIILSIYAPNIFAGNFLDSLSLGLEKEIGYISYQQIITQKEVVQLPQDQEVRLNTIFNKLIQNSWRNKEIDYKLAVVKDDTVNAFALPAGYIFVHTGLLSYAQSDGELAGVLAHEIAHVDRRHSMKSISRTIGMSVLLELIINKSSKKRQEDMTKIGVVAINLAQLGYSRDAEYEADAYGVKFMQLAGYPKEEILNFWRRMEGQSGSGNSLAILQLFSTHPPTSERIKRIEAM